MNPDRRSLLCSAGEAAELLGCHKDEVWELMRAGSLSWQPDGVGGFGFSRGRVAQLRRTRERRRLERSAAAPKAPPPAKGSSPLTPHQAPAPARTASRPAQTSAKPQTAPPARPARPRTIPEMRTAGVRFAGDEAVAAVPATAQADATRAVIDRLVGFSTLRPPPAT